jgi:medium-chain acyl-[acyl-carrier-protein] hydrolase
MTEHLLCEFAVNTMELDFSGQVPLPRICKCAMDAADLHANRMGYDMETLFGKRQAWILVQMHIRIDQYPVGKGNITVKTWPSGTESRFAFREFLFFTEESSFPFAAASSNWILMDLDKGRPMRVSDHLYGPWEIDRTRTLENNYDDIRKSGEFVIIKDFPIRLSDIDPLRHVSNLKYIDCILESVPGDTWKTHEIEELWIEFRKQAVFGDIIQSEAYAGKISENKNEYIHLLNSKEAEKTTFAKARTIRRRI